MSTPNPKPNLYSLPTMPDDPLEANAVVVSRFTSRYRNDEAAARRSLDGANAEMYMTNVRELWSTGAWRHYRNASGEFEWREHEFDYFVAAQLIEPRQLADLIRRGDIEAWAELINSTNPGPGNRSVKTRRPFADVEQQLRREIPGGYDPTRWLNAARNGFGDWNDQQIAKSPVKVRQVKKSSLSAVKEGEQVKVQARCKRDSTKSEAQQQAELILGWLERHPAVADLVKKGL